jgi:hypothetical protein
VVGNVNRLLPMLTVAENGLLGSIQSDAKGEEGAPMSPASPALPHPQVLSTYQVQEQGLLSPSASDA